VDYIRTTPRNKKLKGVQNYAFALRCKQNRGHLKGATRMGAPERWCGKGGGKQGEGGDIHSVTGRKKKYRVKDLKNHGDVKKPGRKNTPALKAESTYRREGQQGGSRHQVLFRPKLGKARER